MPKTTKPVRIRISEFYHNQSPRPLDPDRIKMYRRFLRRGEKLPPIDITYIDGEPWIESGFHRFHAHKLEGRKTILANVIGTMTKHVKR
jgi:uncharacterized ParB-like nuclease family protein